MTEHLTWHPASKKPDTDITVLCWLSDGEWIAGWYESEIDAWRECVSGGLIDGTVTHWSEPQGPQC